MKQNQAEQNEVLQENIPEQEEEEDEKQNFINFLTKSIYKFKGNTGLRAVSLYIFLSIYKHKENIIK